MRILHVTNAVGWSGGLEQMSLMLRELAARGHENHVIAPPGSELFAKVAGSVCSAKEISMHQDYDLIAACKIRAYVKETAPDVVHAHHPMAHALTLVALSFMERPPYVVSRRVSFSPRKNPFSRWKYGSGRITRFVAVSEAVKQTLAEGGVDPAKVGVIYSSAKTDEFFPRPPSEAVRKELKIPEGAAVIGKVANVSRWKGQHVFLDAAKRCLQKNPNMVFVLVGKHIQTLEEPVKALGIGPAVRLLAFRKDIPDVLSTFDVSVNSAIEGEGLSGVMRESLVMEIPVVASDVAGNREIVKDGQTGYLVPVGNSEALSDKIFYALEHKDEAKRFARAGRQWVLEHATLDIMVSNYLKLYQSLVKK